ncbi:hypothetical protein B9Z65_4708 [Elsinoe australis]|uniref:Uncharacterized protein n=1 Tax=Elsinoe australis TaxID=40998 RepID=A0A2P8A5T6_9PEZI|nr:hypothetical protein B9Z65_4708 [Elsinoe australis]
MSAVRWFSADNPTRRILPSKKRKSTQERFSTQPQSPNRLSRFAAVLKRRKIGPYIKVYEDDEIFHAVHDYIVGGTSEVNAALRKSRNTVLKSRRHQFILKRLWVNLLMRRNKEAERKRRSATPAALRQLSISFPEKLDSIGSIPTLQLVPSRRHASSGFPYPDWLADYGIRVTQYILSFLLGCLAESFASATFPSKIFAGIGLFIPPSYYYFKQKNLRKAIIHGHIPCWTACWNKTYFGPKGLSVGFDLPGPIFHNTFVHPKRKLLFWQRVLHGPLKAPMRPSRASRRARITIARVTDPVPHAGRMPVIEPLVLPLVQRFLDAIKNRPRDLVEDLERRANERQAIILELRARRKFLQASERLMEAKDIAILPDLPGSPNVEADDTEDSSGSSSRSVVGADIVSLQPIARS